MARKERNEKGTHRLERRAGPTLRPWREPPAPAREQMESDVVVDMGWGRLVFAHTFSSNQRIADEMAEEQPRRRDIAVYLRDPHVVVSLAPDRLFLDPSHTYRLWSHAYRPSEQVPRGFSVRRMKTLEDAEAITRIYAARQMVTCDPQLLLDRYASRLRTYFVTESADDGRVLGTVTGVDHVEAFADPERGASLWCLAVDPQADAPGVGEALVRHLVEHYFARGRGFVDLSVMHDNRQAIRLYEKLGFERVPVFCVKRKNPINEPLFVPTGPEEELNPYAAIIVEEARRRGLAVESVDAELGTFTLRLGGRSVACRESLTELTSAIAFWRCDDKRLTHRVLEAAGLAVPDQKQSTEPEDDQSFLRQHQRLVVKPARGEQGAGVSVDVRSEGELATAVTAAREVCPDVILEELVEGEDLRVIVIDDEVVAAAVRRPARLTGTGEHRIRELLTKYNRRRAAATGGESRVPDDAETHRCITKAGYSLDSVLPAGETLKVRKTANLHTGGTIHDVTSRLDPRLAEASVAAARALEIPAVGLDLLVPEVEGSDYVIVEANERPGLANHEPQPTAERFVDLLFPQTATAAL
jgi:GNAT-family acetyltransferase (TIGR03103 family)